MNINKAILDKFPALREGSDIEIWYMRPDFFREGIMGDLSRFDASHPEKTHILLGTAGRVSVPHMNFVSNEESDILNNKIFFAMQGENWNSKGEANDFLHSKGLIHSSMSCGDMIRYKNLDGSYDVFVVKDIGFVKYSLT